MNALGDGLGPDGGGGGIPAWVKWLLFVILSAAALLGDAWWIRTRWLDPHQTVSGYQFWLALILAFMVFGGFGTFLKRLAFEPGELSVKPLRVVPGGTIEVVYRQRVRRAIRVAKASIRLVFTEKAVSGSGKSRSTHTQETVVQSVDRESLTVEPGQDILLSARFEIPRDAMHQFSAGSNSLTWTVTVAAEVDGWPDIDEDVDLEVAPPGRPIREDEDE